MINDHIFYIGVDPENGESIITPLPFYTNLSAEKREYALMDLLGWVLTERNKAAAELANEQGAEFHTEYTLTQKVGCKGGSDEPGR